MKNFIGCIKKVCVTNVFQDVVCDACDWNRVDKERKGIQQKKLSDKQYESNINTATEEHVSSENIPRLASLGMVWDEYIQLDTFR